MMFQPVRSESWHSGDCLALFASPGRTGRMLLEASLVDNLVVKGQSTEAIRMVHEHYLRQDPAAVWVELPWPADPLLIRTGRLSKYRRQCKAARRSPCFHAAASGTTQSRRVSISSGCGSVVRRSETGSAWFC